MSGLVSTAIAEVILLSLAKVEMEIAQRQSSLEATILHQQVRVAQGMFPVPHKVAATMFRRPLKVGVAIMPVHPRAAMALVTNPAPINLVATIALRSARAAVGTLLKSNRMVPKTERT